MAAAPEFKALVEDIIATLTDAQDQEVLKEAYELAISNARDAHVRLQALVAHFG